jgi:hypothetical protein
MFLKNLENNANKNYVSRKVFTIHIRCIRIARRMMKIINYVHLSYHNKRKILNMISYTCLY